MFSYNIKGDIVWYRFIKFVKIEIVVFKSYAKLINTITGKLICKFIDNELRVGLGELFRSLQTPEGSSFKSFLGDAADFKPPQPPPKGSVPASPLARFAFAGDKVPSTKPGAKPGPSAKKAP